MRSVIVKNAYFAAKQIISRAKSDFRFNSAIKTTKIEGNKFKAELSDNWNIGNSPNGGYVMCVALNAAQQLLDLKDPSSFIAHYISKANVGPAEITVQILDSERKKVQISLTQVDTVDGKSVDVLRSMYVGTFTNFAKYANKGLTYNAVNASEFTTKNPISECMDGNACLQSFGDHLKISYNTEFRLPKDSSFATNFLQKREGKDAIIKCWLGFPDGELPSIESFPLLLDFCPPVLNLFPAKWVPTFDYFVQCFVRPTKEHLVTFEGKSWLHAKFVTNHVKNNSLYTDAELWSADGKVLLGIARQSARIDKEKWFDFNA